MTPDLIRETLRREGMRWTPQREAVCRVLDGRLDHPTVEEIFRQVRQRHPGVSRATIYNTLEALVRAGLLDSILAEDGTRRYDPDPEPHDHLRCTACGRVADLPPAAPDPVRLREVRSRGFQVERVRVEFLGICAGCRRGARSKSRAGAKATVSSRNQRTPQGGRSWARP